MKSTEAQKLDRSKMDATAEHEEQTDNVLDFSSTLRELRSNIDPSLLRHREGWRDRNGRSRTVEYIEWHSVADILDEKAPNWAHSIKDIREIGEIITVTVAITIEGVTREGIGTGSARSETGIKKAEHDALKRAAVKFGIARELYKGEFDGEHRLDHDVPPAAAVSGSGAVATTIGDMLSAKQLGMIRAMARENNLNADLECRQLMKCSVGELSRRSASMLIDHLKEKTGSAVSLRQAS